MTKFTGKRQAERRRAYQFRLDTINQVRLSAMHSRYEDLLGVPVSLSVLIPRALEALTKELDSFPASLEIAADPAKALRDHELKVLTGLCPG